jgi:hypothetical protein
MILVGIIANFFVPLISICFFKDNTALNIFGYIIYAMQVTSLLLVFDSARRLYTVFGEVPGALRRGYLILIASLLVYLVIATIIVFSPGKGKLTMILTWFQFALQNVGFIIQFNRIIDQSPSIKSSGHQSS